jgi:hypothetical protein
MITKINNANDAMAALSENFTGMVEKKRTIALAKEVTNNIGKMVNLAKVQVVEKMRTGDKEPLVWLIENSTKQIEG